jgi:hypothetical protein
MAFDEQALKKQLAKRGFESVTVRGRPQEGSVQVEANTLHPLATDSSSSGGKPVYAPIPVTLSVALDKRGRIRSIEGGTPDPSSVAAATNHLRMLQDNQQVAYPSAEPPAAKRMTHAIEVDRQGRQVLRRRRFSII